MLPWTHAALTVACIRPPGQPPSACDGRLERIDGAYQVIPETAESELDAAQPGAGEGELGDVVMLWRFRCRDCSRILTAVGCTGQERPRLRNEFPGLKDLK